LTINCYLADWLSEDSHSTSQQWHKWPNLRLWMGNFRRKPTHAVKPVGNLKLGKKQRQLFQAPRHSA
jgi:hypothetical protein